MRVIAGHLRGRKIDAPEGQNTRPITDRAKETLFNVLASRFGAPPNLPDCDVLDLFAGSGSLGIEALSRGARGCTFVERVRDAVAVLRGNLERLRVAERCTVIAANAWTMRLPPAPGGAGYGILFVDPPYRDVAHGQRVAGFLERVAPLLAPDGVLVFRHEDQYEVAADATPALLCVDEREIGHMRLLLFTRAPSAPPNPESPPADATAP